MQEFSNKQLTYYTQGKCHLLSYCLYQKLGGSIVEIRDSSPKIGLHSLYGSTQKFYLDICGRYTSLDHILSFEDEENVYISEYTSASDIEEWWDRHSFLYSPKEKKETEKFVDDNLDRLLNQPYMTEKRHEDIKGRIWVDEDGEDISIDFDVSDTIQKILRGEEIDFSKFSIVTKIF